MRPFIFLCCATALVACAKTETPKADTQAPMAAPPPPVAIKLSDVAGKWNMVGKNEAGDSTLVTYTMTATASTTGWSIQFPGRKTPEKIQTVRADGDSIYMKAGPFNSAIRKGVKVWNEGAVRMHNGMLMGTTTAHYSVKTADSVRRLRIEGTKAP